MVLFNWFSDNTDYEGSDEDDEMFVTNTSFDPYSELVRVPAKRPYDNSRLGPKWTKDELLDIHLTIIHSNTPTEFIEKLKSIKKVL